MSSAVHWGDYGTEKRDARIRLERKGKRRNEGKPKSASNYWHDTMKHIERTEYLLKWR